MHQSETTNPQLLVDKNTLHPQAAKITIYAFLLETKETDFSRRENIRETGTTLYKLCILTSKEEAPHLTTRDQKPTGLLDSFARLSGTKGHQYET